LLDEPDIVKHIYFKRLQRAHHIVQMDNYKIPNKVLDGKFRESRSVGRPHLRWEDNIMRDFLVAAEYNRMDETSRGEEHLKTNY
jgi:hypothetical protein